MFSFILEALPCRLAAFAIGPEQKVVVLVFSTLFNGDVYR